MQYWKARLLPAVAYNGIFSEIDSTHLVSYSNVTTMDFDHIGTQIKIAKEKKRIKPNKVNESIKLK